MRNSSKTLLVVTIILTIVLVVLILHRIWVDYVHYEPEMARDIFVDAQDRFALACSEVTHENIFFIDAESGAKYSLTISDNTRDYDVRWSPDGNRLVFLSVSNGSELLENLYPDIYLIDIPAGDIRRVTSDKVFKKQPQWSPDGEYISYLTFSADGWGLSIVGLDDGSIKNLTNGINIITYEWTLDNTIVANVDYEQSMEIDSTTGQILATEQYIPTPPLLMSPDNRYSLYYQPQNTNVTQPDLSSAIMIYSFAKQEEELLVANPGTVMYMAWIDYGNWVVFISDGALLEPEAGSWRMYRIRPTGEDLQYLTDPSYIESCAALEVDYCDCP